MRPVSQALFHTMFAPPRSMVPFIATNVKAPNIIIVCTTSVHTTAFNPPLGNKLYLMNLIL